MIFMVSPQSTYSSTVHTHIPASTGHVLSSNLALFARPIIKVIGGSVVKLTEERKQVTELMFNIGEGYVYCSINI